MATYEHNALQNYKDNDGHIHIVYPVTKADNVDGIEDYATLSALQTELATKADYEEGTWTPTNVLESSDIDTSVYKFKYSEYKKIGKIIILTTTATPTNYETKSAELVIRSTSLPFSYSHNVLAFAINAYGVSSVGTFNANGGAFKFGTYTFAGASSGLTDVELTIICSL